MTTSWHHRTKTGRVVYTRPVHLFTQKDIERILRLIAEDKPPQFLVDLLHALDDYMLGLILAPIGQADKAKMVREILESFVGSVLAWAGGVLHLKITYVKEDGSEFPTFIA